MSDRLLGEIRTLSDRTHAAMVNAGRPDAAESAAAISKRLDEPLRVAFAGKVKAGKSTLLNAMVGEQLAPTDAGECTKIVTWYRDGHTYAATMHLTTGDVESTSFTRESGAIDVNLQGKEADDVAWLEVMWPSAQLRDVTLIDTPGLGSANIEVSGRTQRFLATAEDGEDEPTEADAVIYLMRHLHHDDMGFLEAFQDDGFGKANPINTVAILSRADEVGACRREAMTSARNIARSYRSDPRLRRLCQTVVPVAGLLAETAATLTESEFQAIAAIAETPADELDALLMSVDRFKSADASVAITPIQREELLDRLGIYGVRVSVSLCRLGAADTAQALADELRELSGIDDLRQLLATMFAQRRDVLKARAALTALDQLVRSNDTSESEALRADLERITASAHEFNEVQLLNGLRSGALELTPAETEEVEQLLGSVATGSERLSATTGSDRQAVLDAVQRWQNRAESPMSSKAVSDAARVVIRSYEGILLDMTSASVE